MKRSIRFSRHLGSGAILLAILTITTPSNALTFTTPPNYENTESSSNNSFPLGGYFGPNGRWQGIYDNSYFSSPIDINQIRFRLDDSSGNAFSTIYSDVQFNLSTFTSSQLTRNFNNNLGADNTTVLNRNSLTLSSSGTGSPRDFDIVVNLDNTFSYDPSNGDLLLEIYNYGGEGGGLSWDAVTTSSSGVVCPGGICRAFNNGDVNGLAYTNGSGLPVAQFSSDAPATAVPFDVSPTLGLLALGGIIGVNRIRKRLAANRLKMDDC
ncbi:hypothetical protein [Myxosarcina sp. GI1]|uniref:PFE-CTERM domain-containing protein n=1 Tax=Myxosarcina sp. GI1 TaxID=1541065 RepID=UPI000564C571|nr:hypothetical protein [Myxosarcina sp. GI1]